MKSFYTLIFFIISQSILSQTGIISGSVVDESSGSSLPGVNVTLKELKKTLTSDSDGKFIFRNIPVGIYEL